MYFALTETVKESVLRLQMQYDENFKLDSLINNNKQQEQQEKVTMNRIFNFNQTNPNVETV